MIDNNPILQVQNLTTAFDTEAGRIRAIDDVSFDLKKEQVLGIVGESGCGKSVTALSIMRLLPKPVGVIESGRILFKGEDIVGLEADKMHKIRGKRISMIFQEPMTSLNPVHRIGKQLGEVFHLHFSQMTDADIRQESIEILRKVGIPEPERRMEEYPHGISGGMRQRVMIALALACKPEILIADEPTTALDVTIQAEIMDLLQELCESEKMGLILITHDLAVVSQVTERIAVMYAGKIVEVGSTQMVIQDPEHPYTRGLIKALPGSLQPGSRLNQIPGMMPTLTDIPPGCAFHPRCTISDKVCRMEVPALISRREADRMTACHMVK